MPNSRTAILNAVGAAARIHHDYGSQKRAESGEGRINVFQMLVDKDIPLLFRPLGGLLGAYIDDPSPGVMITTQRPLAVQRFTAAHELGHAVLGHQPSLDDEGMLARTPFSVRPNYDIQEIQADAFASELLVPRWLLTKHVVAQGLVRSDFVIPQSVYQLSLRLGISYRAMCYSLQRYKAIDSGECDRLLAKPPRDIKKLLAEYVEPETWHGDVWVVTARDQGMLLEGSRTDLVILRLPEHSDSGYVWRFDELENAGLKILEDRRVALSVGDQFGATVDRRITAQPELEARGIATLFEVRPWLPSAEPLNTVKLRVDLSGPVGIGLLMTERERILGAA